MQSACRRPVACASPYEPDIPRILAPSCGCRPAWRPSIPSNPAASCSTSASPPRHDDLDAVDLTRHSSWNAYRVWRAGSDRAGRLILLTTKGDTAYADFSYAPSDTLMFGRESGGVPPEVHEAVDARLFIAMKPGMRSLNIAVAAAMVLGEALRQTKGFPAPTADDPAER